MPRSAQLMFGLFVIAAVTTPTSAAYAWKLGQSPKKFFKDAGEDAKQLGKATADVLSAGEVGRQRDKERAQRAKEAAEAQLLAAKQQRENQIKRYEAAIRGKEELIKFIEFYRPTFLLLKSTVESSIKRTNYITRFYMSQSTESAALREIIDMQQADISNWVQQLAAQNKLYPAKDKTLGTIEKSLQQKLTAYAQQVSMMPRGQLEMTPNLDEHLQKQTEQGIELLQAIDTMLKNMDLQAKDAANEIEINKKSIDELNK